MKHEERLIKVERHIILGIKANRHKVSEPAEKDCGFLGLLYLGDKLKGVFGTPTINPSIDLAPKIRC